MIMTFFVGSHVYGLRITFSSPYYPPISKKKKKKKILSKKEKVLVGCTLSLPPIRNAIKFENCELKKKT